MKIEIKWTYGKAWIAACLAWFVLGFIATGIEWGEARGTFMLLNALFCLAGLIVSGAVILAEDIWSKPLKDSDDE